MKILTYHAVLRPDETDRAILRGHVHRDALDRHLRWLKRNASVVPLARLVEAIRGGERMPARSTVLTFDDGLWNQAEYGLPLLERYELPATFFVTTDHIGSRRLLWFNRLVAEAVLRSDGARRSRDHLVELRVEVESDPTREPHGFVAQRLGLELPDTAHSDRFHSALGGMSEDQLRKVGRSPLIEIGAHTVTHPRLPLCSPDRVEWELVESRRYLEAATGRKVRFFAFPEGDLDRAVLTAVRKAGYEASAAVESDRGREDLLRLPRLVVNRDSTLRMVAKWAGLVPWVRAARRAVGLPTPRAPEAG